MGRPLVLQWGGMDRARQFGDVLETMGEAVVTLDCRQRIALYDRPAGRISGYAASEARGLGMVHGFVRQPGGQIDIARESGGGAEVRIHLPRARSAERIRVTRRPMATRRRRTA